MSNPLNSCKSDTISFLIKSPNLSINQVWSPVMNNIPAQLIDPCPSPSSWNRSISVSWKVEHFNASLFQYRIDPLRPIHMRRFRVCDPICAGLPRIGIFNMHGFPYILSVVKLGETLRIRARGVGETLKILWEEPWSILLGGKAKIYLMLYSFNWDLRSSWGSVAMSVDVIHIYALNCLHEPAPFKS